jgi:O-acetyl-ADP-ribose deacetylase (regulator of RNase III)
LVEAQKLPVQYVSGDLFENLYGAEALAHGCNCLGVMGKGIAVGFRERFPKMFLEYRKMCLALPRLFNPGDCFLWLEQGKPAVFNLATQEDLSGATYLALERALSEMRRMADEAGIKSVAVPRVGAGYGRLDWNKVKEILERIFGDWFGILYVYEHH